MFSWVIFLSMIKPKNPNAELNLKVTKQISNFIFFTSYSFKNSTPMFQIDIWYFNTHSLAQLVQII